LLTDNKEYRRKRRCNNMDWLSDLAWWWWAAIIAVIVYLIIYLGEE